MARWYITELNTLMRCQELRSSIEGVEALLPRQNRAAIRNKCIDLGLPAFRSSKPPRVLQRIAEYQNRRQA